MRTRAGRPSPPQAAGLREASPAAWIADWPPGLGGDTAPLVTPQPARCYGSTSTEHATLMPAEDQARRSRHKRPRKADTAQCWQGRGAAGLLMRPVS